MLRIDDNGFGTWGSYVITCGDAVALSVSACKGGARIIQYREKHLKEVEIQKIARKIREITNDYGCLFIINDNIEITKYLISMYADVNIKDKYNFTAMDYAKAYKNKEMIKLLEEAGAMQGIELE